MLASDLAQVSRNTPVPGFSSRSIWSRGSELTSSLNSRDGTVIAPSSSTFPPTQVVIAISRLVAESFSIDWSVLSNTFCVIGRVARLATARPTMASPLLKFSCRHDTFIFSPP